MALKALLVAETNIQSFSQHIEKQKRHCFHSVFLSWAHLGSNQAPTDYESVALTE